MKVVQERLVQSTVGITINTDSHTSSTLYAATAEEIAGLILGHESTRSVMKSTLEP